MPVVVRPKEASLWRRMLLMELLAGLWVTLKHQFRPNVTEQYPRERPALRPRFRGVPRLRNHPDVEGHLCAACMNCVTACPDHCITVVGEPRPGGKGKQPKIFLIDYERCCLCGMCEEACNTKPVSAIYMSPDFELAKERRVDLMTDLERLYEGHESKGYRK